MQTQRYANPRTEGDTPMTQHPTHHRLTGVFRPLMRLGLAVVATAALLAGTALTASAQGTQNYPCENCPRPIPETGTVGFMTPAEFTVACPSVSNVEIDIDISHTFDADLEVFLESPAGTIVHLWTNVGGSGDGFNVTIADSAASNLDTGTCPNGPCNGTFRPEEFMTGDPPDAPGNATEMAAFDGQNGNGVWMLRIEDIAGGDSGDLNDATLRLDCAAAGGADVEIGTPVIAEPSLRGPAGEECYAPGDYINITQSFGNTGPNATGPQPDNPGPEWVAILPPGVSAVSCNGSLDGGVGACTINGGQVEWNGTIALGETVVVEYTVRVPGGTSIGTEFCFSGTVNFQPPGATSNSASRTSEEACIEIGCESIIDPNTQLGVQVHLPILNFQGQDDVCETWIEVQNIGCDFAKAALITWGEPGFCPPQAAGPLKVECTGMLKPGSTWNFLGAQVPTGSKSGILFKFTTQQLSDIGVDLGFDDIVGDYLCETLFFGVVGDADDYRRFKKAYNEGLEFAGVPLDRATGEGALAVDVHRTCPGDDTPGVEVTSKYNGIAGTHLGVFDEVFGGYGFYVPLVYADASGFNTIMYIQNGGLQCSSVEVWFQEQDACLRASICEILTLAPGESYQLDASDCVGPDFQGSAWLRSSQVMGIAVDLIGRDVLMTYVAEPAEINYTYDPTQEIYTSGNQVAFGPLIYSEYQGWDSGVQVQNLSAVTAAKVKVYFLDKAGGIITTLVDWVCPRGSQTFFLPVIFDLPGNWVGSVRVESQEWFSPGGPLVLSPNIVAVATLLKYEDAARTSTIEALAYNLLPEHKIFDWQIGSRTGGDFEAGVGLIALPSLLRDVNQLGLTSEIAIANVVPKPGFTDFAVYIYDQNGLLDYFCQKLTEKQVEYIDLATWGYVNPGFKGSAIISATFWEHDVFDDQGFFMRNLVGLGAVAIERKGRRGYEEDIPGDEAAGSRGIPFASTFDEDGQPVFEFCFMGYAPLCPGLPDRRFEDGDIDTCRRYPGGLIEGTVGSGASTPGVVSISGAQGSTRLGRFNDTGFCPDGNTCPGNFAAPTTVNYDAIFFDNCEGGDTCVEINFQWLSGGFRGQAAFYLNNYDPLTDICMNHLADNGNTAANQMFGGTVPAGETLVVVVADIFAPGIGGMYEFTLTGDLP